MRAAESAKSTERWYSIEGWSSFDPPMIDRVRLASWCAGSLHGLLLALAFPPIGWWWCALIASMPLVWVTLVCRRKPVVAAFWVGLGTLPFWALAHWWIVQVSALGFLPLAVLMSGFTMLGVWAGCRVVRWKPWLVVLWPLVWVGAEFFRASVFMTGYPWYLLAHPLADVTSLNWLAAWGGVPLVSAFSAVPATAIVAWRLGLHRLLALAMLADAAAWVLLGLVINPWPEPTGSMRVAVVQTAVPQSTKSEWTPEQRYRDWVQMRGLIAQSARMDVDLIALPEAMFPGMTLDADSLEREAAADLYWSFVGPDGVQEAMPATLMAEELIAIQRAIEVPIVIGANAYDQLDFVQLQVGFEYAPKARFNSTIVLDDGALPTKRYDKVHLTPFGEVMPIISRWDWLERMLLGFGARGMRFDLTPGDQLAPVHVRLADGREVGVATPICFEATTSWVCRRLSYSSDVMINLTNDGWFGSWNPGREHHLLAARWRSIELGRAMVRAANTGLSCVIDERGRVIARGVVDPASGQAAGPNDWGVLVSEVPLVTGRTLYSRIGDVFGWLCLFGTCLLLGGTFGRRAKPGQESRSEYAASADEP